MARESGAVFPFLLGMAVSAVLGLAVFIIYYFVRDTIDHCALCGPELLPGVYAKYDTGVRWVVETRDEEPDKHTVTRMINQ